MMTNHTSFAKPNAEKHPPHGILKSTVPFPKLESNQAVIQEVFSSIQGEGLHAGERQVFVRVAHCHLHCAYCDTPMTTPRGDCVVETQPGSNQWVAVPGLQRVEDTEMLIAGLIAQAPHQSVSFTGGEPLLYPYYLKSVMERIQRLGVKTYLETSGTQPHSLAKVLQFVDVISMDVKLPSSTKEAERWQQHADFYRTATQAPHVELFVKVVVNHDSTLDELSHLTSIITDTQTPIYLQPETSLLEEGVLNITPSHLLNLQGFLARHFSTVRVLPQTHKMMKIS
jgi:organic radical activating enzyme